MQPIDAGIGRSIHCSIGNLLGKWLLVKENINKWEGRDRHILISHAAANATETSLKKDDSCALVICLNLLNLMMMEKLSLKVLQAKLQYF